MNLINFLLNLPPLAGIKKRYRQDWLRHEMKLNMLKAEVSAPRYQDRLRELYALLHPARAVGREKVRLGDHGDGGYVMLDDFEGVQKAYSLGIGDNVSWDLEMAKRGIRVRQFDHTVRRSPVANPLFTSPGPGSTTRSRCTSVNGGTSC